MAILMDRRTLLRAVHAYLRRCFATASAARVTEFAQFVAVDRSHLSRAFLHVFGVPPGAILRAHQIRRAARLLVFTTFTNEKIALCSAFGTRNTFQRQFAASTGMTPSEYRAKHRRG